MTKSINNNKANCVNRVRTFQSEEASYSRTSNTNISQTNIKQLHHLKKDSGVCRVNVWTL